jgi:hypothetical protein
MGRRRGMGMRKCYHGWFLNGDSELDGQNAFNFLVTERCMCVDASWRTRVRRYGGVRRDFRMILGTIFEAPGTFSVSARESTYNLPTPQLIHMTPKWCLSILNSTRAAV